MATPSRSNISTSTPSKPRNSPISLLSESSLLWSAQKATIIHPTKGRLAFEPYPYQARFLRDRSSRRLIVKARQVGFSQVFALEAIHKAIYRPETTILLISRNEKLAQNLLKYCYQAVSNVLGEIPRRDRENTSEIGFVNGSRLLSLPANQSTGRGFAASDVYLDEYAFQDYAEDIYRSVSPTVSHGGRLTVGSTPDGRGNHFFDLWEGFEGGDWSRHEVPWWQCPAYNPSGVEPKTEEEKWAIPWYAQERPKYTAQQWASEFECDFVISGQAVFRTEDLAGCADGWIGLQPARPGRRYVTFWDIGRRHDPTVGITIDATEDIHHIVAFERHVGLSYPAQQARIEARYADYPGVHVVESNSAGDPVVENLNVPVEPSFTTAKKKVDMITALALAIENRRFKHAVPELDRELRLYQWNDQNIVQDCVIAAAGAEYHARGVVAADRGYDPEPTFQRRWR